MNDNNQWWDDPERTQTSGQAGGQQNPQSGQPNPYGGQQNMNPQGGQQNPYGGQPYPQGSQQNPYGEQPYQQGGQQPPYGFNPGGGQYNTPPSGPLPPYNPMSGVVPSPGFIESIRLFFSQFATFSGRSRRSEFWYVMLFQFLLGLVISFFQLPQLSNLVSLVLLIPSLALQCRRLHDIGKSGHLIWLQILSAILFLVPMVYMIVYMLYNVPEMASAYRESGIDISDYSSLYPILNIPGIVILIMFLAALGIFIMFLVFNCTDSQRGTNKYGPSSKYPDTNAVSFHP